MAKNVVLVVIQAEIVKGESDQQAIALALTDDPIKKDGVHK